MIRLSINLPQNRRLDLALVKRRKTLDETPLMPDLGAVLRTRKGSKTSRFFRHIFEHKKIRKILGANLAVLALISAFASPKTLTTTDPDLAIVSQKQAPLTTQRGTQYPVEEIRITQNYRFYHPALDLDGETGDPIRPIMAGVVESVSYSRYAYGKAITLNHGNGLTSLYAHLDKINVKKGDKVSLETEIGKMGSTGYTSGDHLHLEIRDRGYPINPHSVLTQ